MPTKTRQNIPAGLVRQPNLDDFIVGTSDDGCPILSDLAPDVFCENTGFGEPAPLPVLAPATVVDLLAADGAHMATATAAYAASEVAKGRIVRTGVTEFTMAAAR